MCGVVGFINAGSRIAAEDLHATVGRMAGTMAHRGPDDHGTWADAAAGVALAHRRLAILDLSPAGHQPMHSEDGRYVISYNGEVYNFRTLAKELEGLGYRFRGHSDTEVMLAAIAQWGIEEAVKRFIGMFAFALWDRREHKMHLVRDRLGIKPLYYGWIGNAFAFSSELKALRAHPDFDKPIQRDVLSLYTRLYYVPAPHSIYDGIKKLPPGTVLTLQESHPGTDPQPVPYWSARDVAERGVSDPFRGSPGEAVDGLNALLHDAVKLRMEADVPLGAFLSGGVDSATVVALMQAQSSRPVRTFTIGYAEDEYSELAAARDVARHIGTDHEELMVTPSEAMAVIPHLPILYDEPFADSSQVPTYLVSELARRHVTVSLSGDGGDEIFCGYSRYTSFRKIWNVFGWMPSLSRRAIGAGLLTVPSGVFDRTCSWLGKNGHGGSPGEQLHRMAEMLQLGRADDMYASLMSHASEPLTQVLRTRSSGFVLTGPNHASSLQGFVEKMMYGDMVSYLPDDILTKVDRASMGVSLEARVPILDHRVVEFAWRLPMGMKYNSAGSKWVLRQVLYRYVPPALIERPKMGFAVPIDRWLRGPLRDWAEDLLDPSRLRREGFFDGEQVRRRWNEYLSGRRKWHNRLWALLMFESWLETQRAPSQPSLAAAGRT